MVDVQPFSFMYQPFSSNPPLDFLAPAVHSTYDSLHGIETAERSSRPKTWYSSSSNQTPTVAGGVRTPPEDMNGSKINNLVPLSYGGRSYNTLKNAYLTPIKSHRLSNPPTRVPSKTIPGYYNGNVSVVNSSSQPSSPSSRRTAPSESAQRRRSSSASSIISYLQIPSSINNSKGSLADFAAGITCLFWFESSANLQRVEDSSVSLVPTTLVREALPSTGFRKWVTTILSTTQVTQNVVLLALLFIYRLKNMNPSVKGKPGSEFRLLTVALMLGNKFLDDNTYTNKTWAEVSGISVQEIHIMEVEFLSNMRYSLFTSETEWKAWQMKLAKFWDYYEKASRPSPVQPLQPSVSSLAVPPSLPSPPASTHASPPFLGTTSPSHSTFAQSIPTLPRASSFVPPPVGHSLEPEQRLSSRKRSYDDNAQEPPSKRVTLSGAPSATSSSTSAPSMVPMVPHQNIPRLPVPNLSLSTTPVGNGFNIPPPSTQLPPPTTSQAMTTSFPPQLAWPQPSAVAPPPLPPPSAQPTSQPFSISPFGDQSRRQSPYSLPSAMSSPASAGLPGYVHSQSHLSPSFILAQRNSPYRPVRSVNTLLVPPPSGSINNLHHLGFDQMHYQPLGKSSNERKTGVVPFYSHDTWSNQTTQWPPLSQPSFYH
ncbi:hypothetical protein L228DRAFT_265102 [Xylona heveae TC161]|uniref:Cyclin-domain-containing protein n=1 Tax=Xylona heveae (strain CBS 132557 / TC161) TaxID=1328760 RepID=A0A165JX37_XYLHT|nr:hypothetical protein L228DRAFT_265102 [Xylona heveae TC161]KZF26732.1 hypothetical protein L228DRAFT_265102 [Xylona heveae TC161]